MSKIVTAFLASCLFLCGCASPGDVRPGPSPSGDLEWIDGPTSKVRSLVLRPATLAPAPESDPTPVTLSVGAYLAKMQTDGGEKRHLALLVQLHGGEGSLALDLTRGLVAEMDGRRYVARHRLDGESVHMNRTDRGRLLSLSFPMDRSDLTQLTRASRVRLQVGGSCFFVLSDRDQDRLRAFLDQLPPDRMGQPLVRVTTDG